MFTIVALQIFLLAIIAGFLGSLLGLGGGIIVTPALTLLFGFDIRYAIGASIVSIIATSSGSAIAYIKDKITNVRIGMFLEIGTTLGAITGAFLSGIINLEGLRTDSLYLAHVRISQLVAGACFIIFIVCIMGLKPSASAETFRSMLLMKL